MAANSLTFAALKTQLASRKFAPVYYLHGEQTYFIDELVKVFEGIIPEADRDFCQYTFYAPQVEPATVVDACNSYSMMSDIQVVIVKEAQAVKGSWIDKLAPYAEHPVESTILVVVSRGEGPKCSEFTKAVNKGGGVIFESKKIYDSQIPGFIRDIIASKGLNIEEKALAMLQDYVGNDLSRIYNEVDKLAMILGNGAMITPEAIERNIGVSKDFNNFELVAAISMRDAARAYRIVEYFRNNPKGRDSATPVTARILFNYFSNLILALYAPDKSERGLMKELGFKASIQLTDVTRGLRNYSAWQIIEIISAIRIFDAQTKGVGSRMDQYDLLQQLVFTILNCTGKPVV